MLVPFEGQRLTSAKVVWINHRWFGERGIDVSDDRTLSRVSDWLLHTFAWKSSAFAHQERRQNDCTQLYCDRYGSTAGTPVHGGSGRVATFGHFQAKGIGVTPLVGVGGSEGHAHGYVSLHECIREAIVSEALQAALPWGSVPSLAIIDTGERFSSPDASELLDQDVPRGILIRPAVVRLAHFERAPMFRTSRTSGAVSQVDDHARCRDFVAAWLSGFRGQSLNEPRPTLDEVARRLAHQLAFCHVNRIVSGGFFSTNTGILGELLDFGNCFFLGSWVRASTLPLTPPFGREARTISWALHSCAAFVNKFTWPAIETDPAKIAASVGDAYAHYNGVEWLRLWGCSDLPSHAARDIITASRDLFRHEQRTTVQLDGFDEPGREGMTASAIKAEIHALLSEQRPPSIAVVRSLADHLGTDALAVAGARLSMFDGLDRRTLAPSTSLLTSRGDLSPERVSEFISQALAPVMALRN
jgi:hypothetical protein